MVPRTTLGCPHEGPCVVTQKQRTVWGRRQLGQQVAAMMRWLWITTPLSIAATAILPVFLPPFLGIMSGAQVHLIPGNSKFCELGRTDTAWGGTAWEGTVDGSPPHCRPMSEHLCESESENEAPLRGRCAEVRCLCLG